MPQSAFFIVTGLFLVDHLSDIQMIFVGFDVDSLARSSRHMFNTSNCKFDFRFFSNLSTETPKLNNQPKIKREVPTSKR